MDLIETTVDLDEVENHEYLIKAEFDEGLQECKQNMQEMTEQLSTELNKAARDLSLEPGKTIKLESNAAIGHYFRVTLKVCVALRNVDSVCTFSGRFCK